MLRLLAISTLLSAWLGNVSAADLHWSFRPLVRPSIPEIEASHPIDAFIAARVQDEKLSLSREADPRTLVRRLYFDLTGLPPTPKEITALDDPSNYRALVERLLGSPRYGERWARHWLDTVRFAETHGFEMNQPRPSAWRYRDYVIRAFNDDLPFDRFILDQLAGDVFGVDEATGFLVAGPWDQVKSPDPVLTANQRADELHDIVSTTSSTFLGLTVGCARCHDHKFDPISQSEYFAIRAVFEGVQHGERPLKRAGDVENERKQRLRDAFDELAGLEAELDALQAFAGAADASRVPVSARRNVERLEPVAVKRLRFIITRTTDLEPCIDELEVYSASGTNIALASAGAIPKASSVYPNSEIHRLEHLNDGRHGNSRSWISNEPGAGTVELEFAGEETIERIVWGRDREEQYQDRLAIQYEIQVQRAGSDDWIMVASSADRIPYRTKIELAGPAPTEARLLKACDELRAKIAKLQQVEMVYAGTFTAEPPPTHRLHRGDPMHPREEVSPGGLSIIPARFPRKSEADLTQDQQRRLALAKWLIHPANPLTARVMVNRIWQYHFGEGLVSTPSDFGLNGARPTHPQLLDWLASEFIDSGWSIKHIHRLILTSGTYRQSSVPTEAGLNRDAASRLLWRFPPRRVEAEALRDSILAISGNLEMEMHGPGYSFFKANDNYVRVYEPRETWPAETFRRMVYGTVVRQRPDGVFGVFDCPDAGQIAPKRTSSTTPLQALNLLNSTFIGQQSELFAARLRKEAGSDPKRQVERAFTLAFQRPPDSVERDAALHLLNEAGLPALCRTLFNANEFAYVF